MDIMNNDIEKLDKLPPVTQRNIHSIGYLTFLEREDMHYLEKFIWMHLDARAGTNRYLYFSRDKICNTIGVSKNTYNKYLVDLIKKNAVVAYRRFDRKTGKQHSSILIVCEYNSFENVFMLPPNMDEIEKAIMQVFSEEYVIKPFVFKTKRIKGEEEIVEEIEEENIELPCPKNSDVDLSTGVKPNFAFTGENDNLSTGVKPNFAFTGGVKPNFEPTQHQNLSSNHLYFTLFLYALDRMRTMKKIPESILMDSIYQLSFINYDEEQNILNLECPNMKTYVKIANYYDTLLEYISEKYRSTLEREGPKLNIIVRGYDNGQRQ